MKIFDLDTAAAVIAATGLRPTVKGREDGGKMGFVFPDEAVVTDAISRYVTDELVLPARQLLQTRGDLYKQIRRAK